MCDLVCFGQRMFKTLLGRPSSKEGDLVAQSCKKTGLLHNSRATAYRHYASGNSYNDLPHTWLHCAAIVRQLNASRKSSPL